MRAVQAARKTECATASADQVSHQRQFLASLSRDYPRQVFEVLRHRELIKGSVYLLKTRCGNASCHCAKSPDSRHVATVLSWSEGGKTRIRSLAAGDRARIRRLTGNYRRLRQSRMALVQLHRRVLEAIDRLEHALLLPPPPPASDKQRQNRR